MTRQLEKNSDDEDISLFKCNICNIEGKCQEGRYFCAECKYAVHEKCTDISLDNLSSNNNSDSSK